MDNLRRILRGLGLIGIGILIVAAIYAFIAAVAWLANINNITGWIIAGILVAGLIIAFAWLIGEP